MRKIMLALGALATIAIAAPAAVSTADAQTLVVRTGHPHHGWHRYHGRHYGWHRGHHYGWRHHHARVVVR